MDKIKINADLYERIYDEIEDYGRADYLHCPGIRLYPHYKDYLEGKIIDLGSGTGETVEFFRSQKFEAVGLDWIEPRNKFCKKANITLKNKLGRYNVATCFDTIEHLTNGQVAGLFKNMTACKKQIFTIANTPSIVTLKNGKKIDLHINKKPFKTWRGIILNSFDIIHEIKIKDYQRLYICEQKHETEEYNEYMAEYLRKHGYKVEKINKLEKIDEGYWFYPVKEFVYGQDYLKKYMDYAETSMGEKLLEIRLDIIKSYTHLLDIGVGSGHIIDNKKNSKGFDVNPVMIKKLKAEKRWCNPYKEDLNQFDVITFFDSFEHIEKPEILLNKITTQTLVIAIPIFRNKQHLLKSKHYRPDEHFHYFTKKGFLSYMKNLGLHCLKISESEIDLGREDIYTFTFSRRY